MNLILLSLVIAAVTAYAIHVYNKARPNDKPLSVGMVFASAFALSALVLYTVRDEKAEVMNEIEVGEPDF